MGGTQTNRIVIAGMTGGGKSYYARRIIRAMRGRYKQLVIINRKRELSELTEAAYIVDEQGDPCNVLEQHKRLFFQVDGYDPRPFLDNLGGCLMKRSNTLLVIDEAWEFFSRGRVSRPLFRVLTGGRELGHSIIFVTQMLKSASGGIDLGVLQQATHLVVFRMQGENDVERVRAYFPELGDDVTRLARPERGRPPEYAVKNLMTGRSGVMRRTPRGLHWKVLA